MDVGARTMRLAATALASLAVLMCAVPARAGVPRASRVAAAGCASCADRADSLRTLVGLRPRQRGTLSLALSPAQPVFGAVAALSATVSPAFPRQPTGQVQFFLDGRSLGDARQLDASGVATATTDPLTIGPHTVRAQYAGSEGSGSVEGEFTVVKASTVTTVVTATPAVAGQSALLSASVRASAPGSGTPTGTIQFMGDGGGPIGEPAPVGPDGTAQVAAALPAGTYGVGAAYGGDSNFEPSFGSTRHQVNRADSLVRIASTPNPVTSGSELLVTVSVIVIAPGNVPVTGTVRASLDGQAASGPVRLDGSGAAQLRLRPTGSARTATLTVTYDGDANANPGAATVPQAITTPATAEGGSRHGPDVAAALPAGRLRDMTAPLVAALRSRGLAALRRSVQHLRAPQPGTLEQRVLGRAGTPTRVLLASGRQRIATAGAVRLRLRVSAPGRRLTRQGRPVQVLIVTRFLPALGAPVVSRTRLIVRPPRATV